MALIQQLKQTQGFTEREKDIVKFVLEHPEMIENMSSRELGQRTFTSAASVTRFCQKLGVKGFPEFKIKFVSELRAGNLAIEEKKVLLSERENVVTIVRKVTEIQKRAVEETQKEISYSQLIRVGKIIAEASCVDFYAYDMNVNLAQYGCSLFFHAGKRAAVYSATNIQGLSANMPSDGHVAIILSHTGRNERLVEIEKILRNNGTKVIAIVSGENRIIAKYADEVLTASGTEKVEGFWTSMFFASGKYILDVLYGMEFSRKYQENLILNQKYEKIGEKILWGLEEK